MKRYTLSLFLILTGLTASHPETQDADTFPELAVLRRSYPDVRIFSYYDTEKEDWKIILERGGKKSVLYRAGGRFLAPAQLPEKEGYRPLIYRFPDSPADPADFTEEQIQRISKFGSTENRRTAPVSGTAFFDALYDSGTRESVEPHIRTVKFLGREVKVHNRIVLPLARVEAMILKEGEGDDEIRGFLHSLGSVGGYSWRQIQDTSGRSFHSMGLAIDLLPVGWQGKVLYWNWEKNRGRTLWMLIPLSERWMPPVKVVELFEREGFIWGGKWPVWDNMHFEYRPELIYGRTIWREE